MPAKGDHQRTIPESKSSGKLSEAFNICCGCLIYGSRVVIPQSLQSNILDLLHNEHFGMERMK